MRLRACGRRFALLSGDPQQLPPLIAHPAHVSGGAPGLLRPLFVRLATLGHPVHMLRRQYRCERLQSAPCMQQCYARRHVGTKAMCMHTSQVAYCAVALRRPHASQEAQLTCM